MSDAASRSRPVGFVGLGNMGWPMARNLAEAGFRLTVRDADADLQRRFAEAHGCAEAGSPEEFSGSDVVVTMLPDESIVRRVVLEWEGGIAPFLAPGSVVVDMSSSNPRGTRSLAADLDPRGIAVVDAPVSGGVPAAEAGTLAIMAGGDDDAVDEVSPIFDALGGRVFRTGPLGSGHAMKALNNYVAASAYAAATEALVIGDRFGLNPGTAVDVLNASTGRSFSTEHVLGEHVVPGRYATGFALGLLAKDVEIAADLAESSEVDAPLCELMRDRWEAAAAELGFATDHSEAHRNWWATELTVAEPASAGE